MELAKTVLLLYFQKLNAFRFTPVIAMCMRLALIEIRSAHGLLHTSQPPAMPPPQANAATDEYMITDNDLLVQKYISVPKSYATFVPGSIVAGMVRGLLDAAGFPARWVAGISTQGVEAGGD
jgi:hypothetical protein